MKWMIASDLHGSLPACRALFEAYDREKADRLLLLGDLFYHGPKAGPPEGYDPAAVTELLNARRSELMCVRGNTDSEAVQWVLEFPVLAEYALLDAGGHVIFAHHGHNFFEGHMPPLQKGDISLSGHTHIPLLEEKDGLIYMNPGSAALPLGGSEKGYMTLEDGVFYWKKMNGEVWKSFSVK